MHLQATFAKYDKDGDGGLTEEEWYEVMKDSGSDISRWETASINDISREGERTQRRLAMRMEAPGPFTRYDVHTGRGRGNQSQTG